MISDNNQEVVVDVAINDLPSESYFRIAWQKSAGKPYFGYMKNNNEDWVKIDSSQGCQNYYHVSDINTTAIILVTKIGQDTIDGLNNGQYSLKVRRYTANCASYTDSEASILQVNLPVPTPTDMPIPTSTRTPTPTKIPTATKSPTATKTPTVTLKNGSELKVPTSIPTKTSVLAAEIKREELDDEEASDAAIPSPLLKASPSATKKEEKKKEVLVQGATTNYLFGGSVIVGGLFLGACGILIFVRNRRKNDYE